MWVIFLWVIIILEKFIKLIIKRSNCLLILWIWLWVEDKLAWYIPHIKLIKSKKNNLLYELVYNDIRSVTQWVDFMINVDRLRFYCAVW